MKTFCRPRECLWSFSVFAPHHVIPDAVQLCPAEQSGCESSLTHGPARVTSGARLKSQWPFLTPCHGSTVGTAVLDRVQWRGGEWVLLLVPGSERESEAENSYTATFSSLNWEMYLKITIKLPIFKRWFYFVLFCFQRVKDFLKTLKDLLLPLLSRFSRVRLCATPWSAAHQAPLSLGFSRQEYWSGLPFPSPMHACMLSHFSRVQLCDPTDSSPPGPSVHGVL